MGYQDFDGKGGSRSHEKLKALRLEYFARFTGRDQKFPLKGLSVLDIGCNEGFFCVEAVRQGAKRVVGIDMNTKIIETAKARCPQANFISGSWWSLPQQKFDVIFFLSAMHYEPKPRDLFRLLATHLTDNGALILECGVRPPENFGQYAWQTVNRWDGPKRYATEKHLVENLLVDYAVRPMGRSVDQVGDTVARYVFHCQPKRPTALLIGGSSGKGKSVLAASFARLHVPTVSTDALLANLIQAKRHQWRDISKRLVERNPPDQELNLARVAIQVAENGLVDEFCAAIAAECPTEADLFCIEGDALRHARIRSGIIQKLALMNVRSWVVSPDFEGATLP